MGAVKDGPHFQLPARAIWTLAILPEMAYPHAEMNTAVDLSEPPRIPAPPELVARAEALAKEYGLACFWFRHPEARVRFMDDVRLVVHHLREYGNQKAWRAAQDLQKCL